MYFSVGHGLQPKLPALCQLYRRAFVSYEKLYKSGAKSAKSVILFCSFVIKYFCQPKVTDGFITSATYRLPTLQTVD